MDKLISPSDVEVNELMLYTTSGKAFDISDLVTEINIYENLLSPVMTADIFIVDAAGLFANTPILGQEKIEGIITQGNDLQDFTFRSVGIEDISTENDYTLRYKINLVEESYYRNATTLISQSYSGSITDIIKSIAEDYLDEDIEIIDESVGNFKLIIPNLNPYKAIRWLMRRAHTDNNSPLVCYKSLYNGLQIVSLETLYQRESIQTFYDRKKDVQLTDSNKDQYLAYSQTIRELTQYHLVNISNHLGEGVYGSRTQLVDIMNKNYEVFDFNYKDQFERTEHLEKARMISDDFTVNGKSIFETSTTKQSNYVHSGNSFGDSHMDYNGDVINSSPYLVSSLKSLFTTEYYGIITGRMTLGVGSIINLQLNKNIPFTANQQNEVLDTRRSGRHIITGLRHKIDSNRQYNLIINFARDTMGAEYNETI